MLTICPVVTREAPRQILAAHYKSLGGELPIGGGWGYSIEDACVILKDDARVDPGVPFDGVGLEYTFVEKRIYEELIIGRAEGEKFSGIRWVLDSQNTVRQDNRTFDHLVFTVSAFQDADWESLKTEYEGPSGFGSPDFDSNAHEKKRESSIVRMQREFWFDITSFSSR